MMIPGDNAHHDERKSAGHAYNACPQAVEEPLASPIYGGSGTMDSGKARSHRDGGG